MSCFHVYIPHSLKVIFLCMDNLETNLSGVDYSKLIASNPYSGAADLYKVSSWQDFVSKWLGQRTEADAWRENMAIQEREYDAALQQKLLDQKYNEEYNSPSAQVSRMRLAGLNPDLDPSSISSGQLEAPGLSQDPSTPMQSSGSSLEDLSNVGSLLLNAVSAAVGLSGDLLSLGQLRESVSSQRIGNADSVVDLAEKSVLGSLPSELDFDPERNAIAINNASQLVDQTVGSMLPRRYRRQFRQNVNRFYTSLPVTMKEYEMRSNRADSRLSFIRKVGSRYYNPQDAVMSIINDEMIKLTDEIVSQSAKNELRSAEVASGSLDVQEKENIKQGEYLDSVDGSLAGSAENAQNQLSSQSAKMTKEINDSMSSIVHRLNEEAKSGNVLAETVLLIFNVLRLRSMNVSSGKNGFSFGISK